MPATDQTPDLKTINEALAKAEQRHEELSKEMLPALQQQKDELHKYGQAQKATTEKLDQHAEELSKTLTEMASLKQIVKELEKGNQRPGAGGAQQAQRMLSAGQQFIKSDALKDYLEGDKIAQRSQEADIEGGFFAKGRGRNGMWLGKAADYVGEDAASDLIPVQELINPHLLPMREPIHEQLMRVVEVETDNIKLTREKQITYLVTKVATAASTGASTLVVESVAGLTTYEGYKTFVHKGTTYTISGVDRVANQLTFTPTLAADADVGDLVTADQYSMTPEAEVGVRGKLEYEGYNVAIKKLLTYLIIDNDTIDDSPVLADVIDRRLMHMVRRMEEKQFFYGNGNGDRELLGFFNDSAIPQMLWSGLPAGTTRLDTLLYAATVIGLADYMNERFLVSFPAFRDIALTKGTDGQFLFYQSQVAGMPTRVWAAPIEPSNALQTNDFACGEWSKAGAVYRRQRATIRVGEPNDTSIKDMKALIAKSRLGVAYDLPKALLRGKFDSQP